MYDTAKFLNKNTRGTSFTVISSSLTYTSQSSNERAGSNLGTRPTHDTYAHTQLPWTQTAPAWGRASWNRPARKGRTKDRSSTARPLAVLSYATGLPRPWLVRARAHGGREGRGREGCGSPRPGRPDTLGLRRPSPARQTLRPTNREMERRGLGRAGGAVRGPAGPQRRAVRAFHSSREA